jgi:aldehyde dehydrogenase (NAD+)
MTIQSPTITAPNGIFINNSWRPGASGKTIPVVAPAEGKVFTAIAAGNAYDIDMAVRAARAAVDGGSWGRFSSAERGRLLSKPGMRVSRTRLSLVPSSLRSRQVGARIGMRKSPSLSCR